MRYPNPLLKHIYNEVNLAQFNNNNNKTKQKSSSQKWRPINVERVGGMMWLPQSKANVLSLKTLALDVICDYIVVS